MSTNSSSLKVGDQVWVKTGESGDHEDLGTILSLPAAAKKKAAAAATTRRSKNNSSNDDNDDDNVDGSSGILVKFSTSGYELLIEGDRIRPMEDAPADETDGRGRTLRRSGRSRTGTTSVLMNVGGAAAATAAATTVTSGGRTTTTTTKKKKLSANAPAAVAASVTPSPTFTASSSSTDSDVVMMEEDDSKSAAAAAAGKPVVAKAAIKNAIKNAKKRKSATSSVTNKATTSKKARASSPKASQKSEEDNGSSSKNDVMATKGSSSPYFDKKGPKSTTKTNVGKKKSAAEPLLTQGKKKASVASKSSRGGRKLMLASSEEDEGGNNKGDKVVAKTSTAKKTASAATAAVTKGKKKQSNANKTASNNNATTTATKSKKKAASAVAKTVNNTTEEVAEVAVAGNQPDGNGGLNQPTPWIVEYSKTGRATCRSCDTRIGKGEIRIGHTPLFRGKPGFMVYRHLHCAVFSETIHCAEDVENYETLTKEDYTLLAEQVDISKIKIQEEKEELRPDELVQKSFQGEIRSEPPGLAATLLPFQVEGFSWMRHQERMEEEIRGGILADEMGMGKTIQTIATMLDNTPKLQHAKPGMKHPPTNANDLKERQDEEHLWDKAKSSWSNEMKLLKVPKRLLSSRDGGARAGTLVICPVIALTQWKTEIEKFTDEGTLSVCTYHGPDREKETPRELMKKYDVVLTTYQVLEADFRKMTSPNRVECPNCGGKFKIDKLHVHLKYFCGDSAERTEAQARQQRNSDRGGGGNNRRGRRPGGNANGDDKAGSKKAAKKKEVMASKDKVADDKKKKSPAQKNKSKDDDKKSATAKKPPAKKPPAKKARKKQTPSKSNLDEKKNADATATPRSGSGRSAARKAASRISRSAAEWAPPEGESDSDNFQSDLDDDGSDSDDESSSESVYSSDSSSNDSALERAREKQRQALEMTKNKKKKSSMPKKKQPSSGKKAKGKKTMNKKPAAKGKGKPKKFDDDSDDDYSSSDSTSGDGGGEDEIDMAALIKKAMAGAKNSVLHSLCWWRIVLDEAHFIKSRSSQTANAAFSLIGVHRWCLSGTPLQNRVGEFYSLVRFLRLDPMAYYYCRAKDCDCKSMHYRIHAGRCEGCNHGGIQHYSHFNKYILNPIQRDGYSGDGRRAMFLLKNEVLDKALLRRTKDSRAADMELPPRLVQIKPVRLHPVEEDFYSALYTQTQSSFNDYVDSGTLLNNYAHIFDLLIRMRQSVDHPYLVIYSKKNTSGQTGLSQTGDTPSIEIANGSVDCDLCHEPPTDRVVSTCCGAAYCRACVLEYMATTNSMAASANLPCPSCREAFSIDLQARADVEDDSSLKMAPALKSNGGSGAGMPSLKELRHVATGSILRRINLAEFATSSKIEALTRDLVLMRQTSPGSKAIVFSQFVNMLDLIRWRLHSDPYLEDIGLGCRALHGGMNVKARDACLKEFREDNNVRVLLMSLKAGGVALNLTCANYIYLMDPWWNPAAEMQAIDRTHRLGQYRPIRAVRFIAENTVEERILQLQEKKRLVFDGTVGRDAGSLKMLTVDDMKSLFA